MQMSNSNVIWSGGYFNRNNIYYRILSSTAEYKISGEYDLVPCYLYWQDICTIKSLPHSKSYNGLTQPKKYKIC